MDFDFLEAVIVIIHPTVRLHGSTADEVLQQIFYRYFKNRGNGGR